MGRGDRSQGHVTPLRLSAPEQATLDTYERSATSWADSRSGSDFWINEIDHFSRLLPEGKLVDIGSGSGRDAKIFNERGYSVTGIDVSNSLLEVARANVPDADFIEASVYQLPFEDDSQDGLWACASLLHLPKERLGEALNEMRRVLKPGGAAFISVKAGKGEELQEGEFGTRYFSYYQPQEFQDELGSAGFAVTKLEERTAGGADWISVWCT